MMGWQWHQLNHFAPRSRQITTPVPHHSVFTGRMPFLPPKQQGQSTEEPLAWLLLSRKWANSHNARVEVRIYERDRQKLLLQVQLSLRIITDLHKTLNKDQLLSLTNPRDALHHGERAANK